MAGVGGGGVSKLASTEKRGLGFSRKPRAQGRTPSGRPYQSRAGQGREAGQAWCAGKQGRRGAQGSRAGVVRRELTRCTAWSMHVATDPQVLQCSSGRAGLKEDNTWDPRPPHTYTHTPPHPHATHIPPTPSCYTHTPPHPHATHIHIYPPLPPCGD